MSLPWFAFNIKDFAANTKRLNTEAKGAYLELMLDYYQTEEGPPDDDEVLATITGLSVETWKRHRRVIAPLFEIKDQRWTHHRIEQEILDGHLKHTMAVTRAQVASDAAAAKRAAQASTKTPTEVPTKEPKKDKPTRPIQPKNLQGSNDGPNAGPVKVTPKTPQTQTQTQLVDGGGDARAREPDTLASIEDALTGSQPVMSKIPIDHWQPEGIDPGDIDILNRFVSHHLDNGTFSGDWPTLWQTYLAKAKAPPKPKPPRKAPPRVETNKRPEPIPGVRVLISPEAFALADEVTRVMGVEHMPVTVGMPSTLQTWMASWPPEIILLAIEKTMARRPGDPPGSMKYFENAIAREFAESKRPLPVATIAPQTEIVIHGRQRSETKSLPDAADRLVDRIAAFGSSGTVDSVRESPQLVGPVSEV